MEYKRSIGKQYFLGACFFVVSLFYAAVSQASGTVLRLAVQPALTPGATLAAYQPLANYLSRHTGIKVKVVVSENFQAYWNTLLRNDQHDLALDAAHFAGYRILKLGYRPLAKINDTVGFSMVTNEEVLLFDVSELIGKSVAAVPSPSLAGVRLAELFNNPMRQPQIVPTTNFPEALAKVSNKQAIAALVPTSLVSGNASVNTVMTTETSPHSAFTVSSRVDAETSRKIQLALLQADKTEKGKKMLEAIRVSGFEAVTRDSYVKSARLLESVWGY